MINYKLLVISHKLKNGEKGQTLLELLVALSVGIIIVTAVTVSILSSLSGSQFNRDQSLATSYAQDGMENIRKLRDQNWSTFAGINGTFCMDKSFALSPASGCASAPNVDNTFIREVTVQSNGCASNASKVTVQVQWTDGECPASGSNQFCHKTELNSCLNNLYAAPTL